MFFILCASLGILIICVVHRLRLVSCDLSFVVFKGGDVLVQGRTYISIIGSSLLTRTVVVRNFTKLSSVRSYVHRVSNHNRFCKPVRLSSLRKLLSKVGVLSNRIRMLYYGC